ncbi:MAG: hypothetical protein KDI35_16155, partial [Gammaproteobacteria bacterium]|nr:hypothetical protein [Gammaproteobacteria bacterium]
SQPVMMLPVTGGSGWESVIDRKTLSGSWKLALHLSARTLAGNQLEIDLEPVVIDGLAAEPLADPPPELEEAQTSEGTEPDWIMLASLFGAGNLLLLSIAGVAFWLVRRGSAKDQIQLLGDEDAVDAEGAAG